MTSCWSSTETSVFRDLRRLRKLTAEVGITFLMETQTISAATTEVHVCAILQRCLDKYMGVHGYMGVASKFYSKFQQNSTKIPLMVVAIVPLFKVDPARSSCKKSRNFCRPVALGMTSHKLRYASTSFNILHMIHTPTMQNLQNGKNVDM